MKKELYETNEVESILKQKEIEEKGSPERERTFEDKGEIDIDSEEFESSKSSLENDLNKVREKVAEFPDKKDENENCDFSEEGKLTLAKFREETEKKAEKFNGYTTEEVVNFVRDTVSNLKVCEGAREDFAEVVSGSIFEMLKDKLSKEELSEIEEMIDIGGGYGENLELTIKKIEEETGCKNKINGVCLDNKTSLSSGVKKNPKIVGSYQNAEKTSFEEDSFDLVMATHLLQEVKEMDAKEDVLREMARISKGRIVLLVEFERSGFDGQKDKLNHFINNFNIKYDVLEKKEYEDLFEKLGFIIEVQIDPEKSPNKITYLLRVSKKEDKTE